jgi:hypothetical protein
VVIDTLAIALPNFNDGVWDWIALTIQNATTQPSDLAHSGGQLIIDDDQIVIRIKGQLIRVKRPFRGFGRQGELFGK